MSESSLNHHTTAHEHRSRLQRATVLAVASIAQFMIVLDVTIINVALPQMRSALHMSASGQQWVINAYALTFGGFLMLGGRAADVFGRCRVLIAGLATFTLFSLLGGFAQTGAELIAARAAQGIGGAILAPASLSQGPGKVMKLGRDLRCHNCRDVPGGSEGSGRGPGGTMEALTLTVVCHEGRPPAHAIFLPDGCCPQPEPS